YERCVKNVDIDEGIRMISMSRQATLLNGLEGMDFSNLAWEKIQPELRKCYSFRLDYESIVEWDIAGQMQVVSQVRAKVPLEVKADFTSLTGKGRLEYLKFDVELAGQAGAVTRQYCPIVTEKHNSTMWVEDFVLRGNLRDTGKVSGDFVLIDPGMPKDGFSFSCRSGQGMGAAGGGKAHDRYWQSGFATVNEGRRVEDYGPNLVHVYLFDGFQRGGKPLIARLTGTATKTVGGAKMTETFTMELFHDPKK
ncbi:MAG TPA: hypothetical protein VHS28_00670, partial [Chloroflexota bacterium]|nr:hypothetical protein [Chloroflexota bacterium]